MTSTTTTPTTTTSSTTTTSTSKSTTMSTTTSTTTSSTITTVSTATQEDEILDLEINLKISSNGNQCPICESGKSIEDCLKMNKQECGKDKSCSMSVRSRGGRIESVNFECKQHNACKNEKIQNGMKWGQGQCTPAKPNGP